MPPGFILLQIICCSWVIVTAFICGLANRLPGWSEHDLKQTNKQQTNKQIGNENQLCHRARLSQKCNRDL